jgi:Domain of unknown function (DUF5615)
MKVLFDQNVPRNLVRHLIGHEVTRSVELGWQELKNGDLLRSAQEKGFDLMVTADRNFAYQQNLQLIGLAIIVLPSGTWPQIRERVPEIIRTIDEAQPGSFRELQAPLLKRRGKRRSPSI